MAVNDFTDSSSRVHDACPDWVVINPTSADVDLVATYGYPAVAMDINTIGDVVVKAKRTGDAQTITVPAVASGGSVPYHFWGQITNIVKAASTVTQVVVFFPQQRR